MHSIDVDLGGLNEDTAPRGSRASRARGLVIALLAGVLGWWAVISLVRVVLGISD